jgi:predicted nucleotidyltransferase
VTPQTWSQGLPEEVDELLARLLEGQQRTLNDRLLALYLFGSAATGTFETGLSDVDTVAVLSSDATDEELSELAALHDELVHNMPQWNDRVEVVYLSATALAAFREGSAPAARVSPGEPFHRIEVDRRWVVDWYRVRERGIALHGPPPADLIPRISHSEFVEAVRDEMRRWPQRIAGRPTARMQAYAVLTMCRGLRLCRTGEQVSKAEAARWAARELPAFAPLIRNAVVCREESRYGAVIDDSPKLGETPRFVKVVAEMVR